MAALSSEQKPSRTRREATLYDAVAGRISAHGFITEEPIVASTRDTASSSLAAVGPESVLFRRKHAPVRYQEADFYFANDALPPRALPDSDLLKALHGYTSDFYSRVATEERSRGDWRSLDETALLAMGILMEEMCRDALGDTGDLVFTEAEEVIEEGAHAEETTTRSWRQGGDAVGRTDAARESVEARDRKRRKLVGDDH
ncbi:MAG: hypothetical protein M1818_002734 [Claussenomyces sp. TS43310]|nr:MAG: hypothetical protein M1818_002734 [Claussenomyces sp. TS43310]